MPFSILASKLDRSNVNITLLQLLPGEGDQKIVCNTQTIPLKTKPRYETLSYVWGDQSTTRQITCGGSPKVITESLFFALSQLRLPHETRTLWIDQLCIDQTNKIEKSYQVSVMRSIYKEASHGLIWLGKIPKEHDAGFDSNDVAVAFKGLADLDAHGACAVPNDMASRHRLGEVVLALMGSSRARWQGVKWWQRIWTIQEAKLPTESSILWGDQSVSFNALKRVAVQLTRPGSAVTEGFEYLFSLGPLVNDFCIPIMNLQINDPAPILGPLYRWRYREATNPLDKVYALMGILPESSFQSVPFCDYTLSTKELYTRVTVDLIRHDRGLLPVCGRRGEPRITLGLPSWAVDWTLAYNPMQRSTDYFGHCWRYNYFDCAKQLYVEPELTANNTGLILSGVKVDRIATLGPVNHLLNFRQLSNEEYDDHTRRTVHLWKAIFDSWSSSQPLGQSYVGTETMTTLQAFYRVLIGDLAYHYSSPDHRVSQEELAWVEAYIKSAFQSPITASVQDMARSQAFFITDSGYLGIGPPDAQVGDEVWVLLCGNIPHILRPKPKATDESAEAQDQRQCLEFKYVGDAYVQGVMDGEVIDKSDGSFSRVVLY
ncbi:heterokaryon incompatibility [Fusarium albosuccineum]|uniref:Heterokaryon incompatibility n=1 Tax=Fusarium albosuccineum TaxID=1237068 RepID=A0A8H4KUV4_9HYPO|nr:heterokaryon incompatibility [Fusarium albosuccineum]